MQLTAWVLHKIRFVASKPGAILFGTDYPFGGDAAKRPQALEECRFSADELYGIHRENALKLLPRYTTT
jgi:predicted TIM-barrel fold metal-dependent hydrolase